ncbi:MAG: hypothetical protein JWQ84_2521, partial [Mucilaginibacter sp.]|nr:hypothetical protein [Mucilaginibacter sp.]
MKQQSSNKPSIRAVSAPVAAALLSTIFVLSPS